MKGKKIKKNLIQKWLIGLAPRAR